jgi:D-alanyl-D-alanine carboxypeptidase
MTGETKKAYDKLKSAGAAAGCNFYIVSAYRSISYQGELYDSYLAADGGDRSVTDTYSARPGHSSHHSGRTIDLAGENGDMDRFGETKSYAWLKDNAYKFGFVFDYTEENKNITGYMPEEWQITFVGKKAALIMHEGIESIEEYFVKHVMYSAG